MRMDEYDVLCKKNWLSLRSERRKKKNCLLKKFDNVKVYKEDTCCDELRKE